MIKFLKNIGFVAVNLLLIWHVFAIAISPSSMPPASPLLADASNVARPYNQALFLNHGYHYFAPNPGSSSLMEFQSVSQGDIPKLETIPDVDSYFPRLRYHRFFMLAENVWAFGDDAQREFIEGYARHFSQKMKSESVSVISVSHDPAAMRRIVAGGDLKHPTSYLREPLADFQFAADGQTIKKSFFNPAESEVDIELLPSPVSLNGLESNELSTELSDEANAAGSAKPLPLPPVPQAAVPQTTVPQTTVPQAAVPQTTVPQAPVPLQLNSSDITTH